MTWGRRLASFFYLSAMAPTAYAAIPNGWGGVVAMQVAATWSAALLMPSLRLWLRVRIR